MPHGGKSPLPLDSLIPLEFAVSRKLSDPLCKKSPNQDDYLYLSLGLPQLSKTESRCALVDLPSV